MRKVINILQVCPVQALKFLQQRRKILLLNAKTGLAVISSSELYFHGDYVLVVYGRLLDELSLLLLLHKRNFI
jgi:hypothetical protein